MGVVAIMNCRVKEAIRIVWLGAPIVAQWLTNLTRNHEDVGSIPGLAQWVRDLALLWAVVWVADGARIPHYCGCGVGQWPKLRLDICHEYSPKKTKDKKKERKETHPTAKEVLQWAHVHGFQWTLSVPHHPDVTGLIDWWNGLLKTQLLAAIPYMTRARFSSGLHMLWIGVQYMALFLPQPRFTGPGIKGWMWEWQYSLLPLVTYQQFFFFLLPIPITLYSIDTEVLG